MINIRLATSSDIQEIATIANSSHQSSWTASSIESTIKNSQALILIYESDARILAYAILYFAADEAEIPSIAVKASHRRQGIGKRLLQAISEIAAEKGIEHIYLEVRSQNIPAKQLYNSLAFTEVGIRKNFYTNPPDDAIVMKKVI